MCTIIPSFVKKYVVLHTLLILRNIFGGNLYHFESDLEAITYLLLNKGNNSIIFHQYTNNNCNKFRILTIEQNNKE